MQSSGVGRILSRARIDYRLRSAVPSSFVGGSHTSCGLGGASTARDENRKAYLVGAHLQGADRAGHRRECRGGGHEGEQCEDDLHVDVRIQTDETENRNDTNFC